MSDLMIIVIGALFVPVGFSAICATCWAIAKGFDRPF